MLGILNMVPRCCSFSTSAKFSSMPFHRDKRSLKDKLQSLQHLVPQRISGRTKQTLPERRKGRAKGTKIKGLSLLKPCVFNTCHVRFMSWKLSRVCDSNLRRVGVYMLWTTSSKRTAEGYSCIHDAVCVPFATASVKMGKWHNHSKQQAFPPIICKPSNKVDGTTAIAILAIKMWHLRHNTINCDFDMESRKQCWTLRDGQHTMCWRLQDLWETVPKAQADSDCEWNQACHSDWIPPNINNSLSLWGWMRMPDTFCIFLPVLVLLGSYRTSTTIRRNDELTINTY